MLIEELLKPRYKVIADYPNSRFKLDEILTQWIGNNYSGEDKYFVISNVEKFPHIFSKLQWWEDREIEDLPQYLKEDLGGKVYYYKVEKYSYNKHKELKVGFMVDGYYDDEFLEFFQPATQEEYEVFTKNK